jgi:hypothetical protein
MIECISLLNAEIIVGHRFSPIITDCYDQPDSGFLDTDGVHSMDALEYFDWTD